MVQNFSDVTETTQQGSSQPEPAVPSDPGTQHTGKRLRVEVGKLRRPFLCFSKLTERSEHHSLPASHSCTRTLFTPSLLTFVDFLLSPFANSLRPATLTLTEILTSGNLLWTPSPKLPTYIRLSNSHPAFKESFKFSPISKSFMIILEVILWT